MRSLVARQCRLGQIAVVAGNVPLVKVAGDDEEGLKVGDRGSSSADGEVQGRGWDG